MSRRDDDSTRIRSVCGYQKRAEFAQIVDKVLWCLRKCGFDDRLAVKASLASSFSTTIIAMPQTLAGELPANGVLHGSLLSDDSVESARSDPCAGVP